MRRRFSAVAKKTILSLLLTVFIWGCTIPLVRPDRIDWNASLAPATVKVKGHTIFYAVKGEGEPVILLHGFGAAMWVWERQIEALSRHYRVYALDLIGHGFSDRPKIPYTPKTYIQFLKDFMDEVGIKKATLIGNSMGGGLACAVAIFFPERVNTLILINSTPPDVLDKVRNESFRALVAIKDLPLLPYLVMGCRGRNSVKWLLQESVSNIKLITPEIVDRQYQISRIKGTTWVLYSTFKNADDAKELKSHLSSIAHPTLLIWGEWDLIFPLPVAESLHQAIYRSELRVIENAGHMPMWEAPEEVNQAILAFLRQNSSFGNQESSELKIKTSR
jgi:pimeloyl-ACP methyl ester carboxylesterase